MDQEQVEYYVWKYQAKMWGSRKDVAKEWISGIESITQQEQKEVYKRVSKTEGATV